MDATAVAAALVLHLKPVIVTWIMLRIAHLLLLWFEAHFRLHMTHSLLYKFPGSTVGACSLCQPCTYQSGSGQLLLQACDVRHMMHSCVCYW
jgi:hypothetical protein